MRYLVSIPPSNPYGLETKREIGDNDLHALWQLAATRAMYNFAPIKVKPIEEQQ